VFLVNELREWRIACPKGHHDLVFPNLVGNPISAANLLQRGFYPALRRAGLRQIFHDLRHTFASLLIAAGEDIVRVSRLLGHASPTITLKVYSHMLPAEHYTTASRLTELVFAQEPPKTDRRPC
jgi:integrase